MSVVRWFVLALVLLTARQAFAQSDPGPGPELPSPAAVAPDSPPAPAALSPRFQRPTLSVALVAGGAFQYLINTPFVSGGGELRIGALTRRVEVSARLRFLAGRSVAGLAMFQPGLTLGVMFPVDSRVRIGAEIIVPPLIQAMFIRYVTQPRWARAVLAGLGFETSVDLWKGFGNHALFWVGTVGIDFTTVNAGDGSNNQQPTFGPRLWTGIGYRL